MNIRPFEERDYGRIAEVAAVAEPERGRDAEWYRQRDATLDAKVRNLRLLAELDGRVVGWGDLFNTWWMYHPRKFQLRLNVQPDVQGQGVGSAIYERLMDTNWSPLQINCEARETRPHSASFLQHRGFNEVARRWESQLRVAEAQFDRFAEAMQHLRAERIRIVNMADERRRRGDSFTRELFDLEQLTYLDEPGYDPEGTLQFDQFVANELDPSIFVEAASYLAVHGEQMVGLSRIERDRASSQHLHVGFTGTHPDYRGRGIAFALKLHTIHYAQAHGYTAISTTNDSHNAPMLHINAVLGFQRQPAWIVFEKRYSD